jgi:hypothetical protein
MQVPQIASSRLLYFSASTYFNAADLIKGSISPSEELFTTFRISLTKRLSCSGEVCVRESGNIDTDIYVTTGPSRNVHRINIRVGGTPHHNAV